MIEDGDAGLLDLEDEGQPKVKMLRACMEVNREESGEIEGDCRVTLILWLKNLSVPVDEICAFQRKWLGGCLFASVWTKNVQEMPSSM